MFLIFDNFLTILLKINTFIWYVFRCFSNISIAVNIKRKVEIPKQNIIFFQNKKYAYLKIFFKTQSRKLLYKK